MSMCVHMNIAIHCLSGMKTGLWTVTLCRIDMHRTINLTCFIYDIHTHAHTLVSQTKSISRKPSLYQPYIGQRVPGHYNSKVDFSKIDNWCTVGYVKTMIDVL